MEVKKNIPIASISWLSSSYKTVRGGVISEFYEPENRDELVSLSRELYLDNRRFDVIGHTSNIYFTPEYSTDVVVSTRKVNNYTLESNCIVCDCGVSVRSLAHQMLDAGVKGFEGLIDLPGTVGASIYGNAGCFGCSINQILIDIDYITPNGEIVRLPKDELKIQHRSTAFKTHEIEGVIISARLKCEKGDRTTLKDRAVKNHAIRTETQPSPSNNLGSIFKESSNWSFAGYMIRAIAKFYEILFINKKNVNKEIIEQKKKEFIFRLLVAEDLLPYVYNWNRFIWLDDLSHTLFWKYVRIHKLLFSASDFEIEIKQNENSKSC